MIKGGFYKNSPYIQVIVAWGRAVQAPFFILDTGFTGDLMATPRIATELGLIVTGVENIQIADGSIVRIPTALALASMEGKSNLVTVLIQNSTPLAGISLFTKFGYKAIVDCKHITVELHSA